MRHILASASPARFSTLNRAGVRCEVVVSGADESTVTAPTVQELVQELAVLKGRTVVGGIAEDALIIACDTMLEFQGQPYGKPVDEDDIRARWRDMRGNSGIIHTGHHVIVQRHGTIDEATRVESTTVNFADVTDEEIDAYIATGEPQRVAGAFTVDGFGGAFISSVVGDHHNVVGISLPLLRSMCADLGVPWTSLWQG